MTEDADAPEIHTDPLVQSKTLKKMSRQLIILPIIYFVFLVGFLFMLVRYFTTGDWVNNLLLRTNVFFLILVPLFMLGGIYLVVTAVRFTKLHRRLKAGYPLDHSKKKRSKAIRILELVSASALVFMILSNLANLSRPNNYSYQPLSDAPGDMPALSLAEIDSRQSVYYSGAHFDSRHSPLVPEQYTVGVNIQTDEMDHIRTVLHTNFYKTAFPGLAKPVYKEMIQANFKRFNMTTSEREMQDYETLDTTLFDEAVYTQFDDKQYIIAYQDKTVIVVRYVGDVYLPDKLELIADAFLH